MNHLPFSPPAPPAPPGLTLAEAERRRAANRRLGWTLGAVVLMLYLLGLFVPR